jgi:putative ABC transport system permease protein
MLRNNNGGVIRHITKNSLSANKLRNRLIGAVIILSAFLLSFSSTFGFNAALDLRNINLNSGNALSETVGPVIVIAVIIFLACILAVYNIFYISIAQRLNEYGQLRTIGATTKQIKKMVIGEGLVLSARYIPFGVVPGCLASYIVSPAKWYAWPSFICVIASCGITLMTVLFSTLSPARLAASVSPLEAVRYTGYGKDRKKPSDHLSPISLGIANILKNKRKTVLTFLSLTLSGILFIGAASVMNSVNPAERAKSTFMYGGEYKITLNWDMLSPTVDYHDLLIDNPLSPKLMEQILRIDGIDHVEIYKEILCSLVEDKSIVTEISNIKPRDVDYLVEESLDDSGIVINRGSDYYKSFGTAYHVGDTIRLMIEDGNNSVEMSFNVCGIINNKDDGGVLYLPAHVMDEIVNENCNITFEILSGKGYSPKIADELESIVHNDKRLSMVTLNGEIAFYKSAFRVITTVLYAFIAFIGIFAIVNLINTIITNALSRKREIGMLQAIGMDTRQFRQMLRTEHSIMLLGSFVLSLLIGGYGGYVLCNAISNIGGLSFVHYQFPAWQIAVYFVLIVLVQVIFTAFQSRSMSRQSIVQRIYQL